MQQEDFLLKLRAAYAEISKGYTATSFKDSPVYLKHYTEPDILELDLLHQKYFEEAKSKGLFTLKEKLDQSTKAETGPRKKKLNIILFKRSY